MSSIEKMMIQGIRSFGPEDRDKGLILFQTPLTLILGPNGTGKTTIIECLKYITTGIMPPGSNKGAAFVHDPKVAKEPSVMAQVKLSFRDVKGEMRTVERSLVLTQKRVGNPSIKTIDGVMSYIAADGKKTSIGHRCADLDREMIIHLGVSRAVLESVIFCHQEDSNWPLSEGKALKTRFDDIFASTRYVKALDSIKKQSVAQKQNVALCKEGIKHFKHLKELAAEYRTDLATKEGAYASAEETIADLNEKLKPIQENINKIDRRLGDIYQMNTDIEKLKTKKKEIEKHIQEIRAKIETEFEGTTDELRESLRKFEQQLRQKNEQLNETVMRLSVVEGDLEDINEEKHTLIRQQGKLEQEAEHHKNSVARRDQLIRDTCRDLDIPGYEGVIDSSQVDRFLALMEKRTKQHQERAKKNKSESEEKEASLQKEIDRKNQEKTQLTTKHNMQKENIRKNKSEIRSITQELSVVAASGDKLQQVQRDLTRAEAELAREEDTVNLTALKQEITGLQSERSQLQQKLTNVDGQVARMSREAEDRTRVELLSKDCGAKEDALRRLKAKSGDALEQLLGDIPDEAIGRQVGRKMTQQSHEMSSLSQRLDKLRREVATLEAKKTHIREELNKTESDLRKNEQKIASVCDDEDIETAKHTAQRQMQEAQDTKGYLLGTQRVFDKYKEKLARSDPPCPLCHRPFDSQEEVHELIAELESKLQQLPERLEQADVKIENKKQLHEDLLLLQPVKEQVDTLKQKVPSVKSEMESLTKKLEQYNKQVTKVEEEKEACTEMEKLARSVQGDVTMIDKYQTEIKDLRRKLQDASSMLSTSDADKSLQEVQNEREDLQLQLGKLNMTVESKQKKREEQTDHLARLKSQVNDQKSEKLRLEAQLQKRVSLEQKREQLENENEALNTQVEDGADLMAPLEAEITELVSERETVTRQKETQWEQARSEYNKLRGQKDQVQTAQEEVARYLAQGKDEKLSRMRKDLAKLEQRASDVMSDRTRLNSDLNALRQDLDQQQTKQRDLEDNLSWREKEDEIRALNERIRQKEEQMGGLDVHNLEHQKEKLQTDGSKYVTEKSRLEGRKQELREAIRGLKGNLRDQKYSEADAKYNAELINLRTVELAILDLDKYYQALDKAIMSYHKTKMDEINKIIRELWQNTYQGKDIQTIEIQSDEDNKAVTASSRKSYNYRVVMIKDDQTALDMRGRCSAGQKDNKAVTASSRKSYNYRVVMIKDDQTALDMRGRCSAGQKVLASLIIRLALAETFCLNCGILALDEPTTNLDRENIESLAHALVEIIKSRAGQKNFQLIVITHDEDFVELLGRSDYVDEFTKVRKDRNGYSQLVRAKVQDIGTR